MAAVPLNDRFGTFMDNLKVGWTKEEAMRRLNLAGRLYDRHGFALDLTEQITEEGGPYSYKAPNSDKESALVGLSTEDSARKRQKTFSTLLQTGDFKAASRQLRDAAVPFEGDEPDDPKTYCVPSDNERFRSGTWNKEEMKKQLCELREEIQPMLKAYVPHDRKQVVIGLRLGTGFGKTHVLTRFPQWLSARGIYVTYSDNQNLDSDRRAPEKAIYIRLILALYGWSSKMCSQFMNGDESSPFWQSTPLQLRTLYVHEAKKLAQGGPIAIGVDELKDLGDEKAKVVVSELAGTAAQYLKETSSMCTVVVSSLVSATFKTERGRSVYDWGPRRPSMETFEYFAENIRQDKREQAMALINAVSGAHMRSIVVAFDLYIKKNLEPTVRWMYQKMVQRLGAKEDSRSLRRVVDYVKECLSQTRQTAPIEDVEVLCDETGSIPPVFLMMAFEAIEKREHLENLLNAFSLFDGGPGKQLEAVAKHYDLFRADLVLPVVPGPAVVNTDMEKALDEQWYRQLRFPVDLQLSEHALLQRKGEEIVPTDVVPEFGHYYHPKISNHPYINRAFVARNREDRQLCLVVTQDKVNASDFPDACRKLNEAARLLTTNSATLKHVLLIVNVIGASEGTRAQAKLEWPFVLIRGQQEVRNFYSTHFADMVWFARQRHLLSFESSTNVVPATAAPTILTTQNVTPATLGPTILTTQNILPATVAPKILPTQNVTPATWAPTILTTQNVIPTTIVPTILRTQNITPANIGIKDKT